MIFIFCLLHDGGKAGRCCHGTFHPVNDAGRDKKTRPFGTLLYRCHDWIDRALGGAGQPHQGGLYRYQYVNRSECGHWRGLQEVNL